MEERDTLRAAAFGSFNSRDEVFGERLPQYYDLLLLVLKELEDQLASPNFNKPELDDKQNRARRQRANRLRGRLVSLRDQMQNVLVGLKKPADYCDLESIFSDKTLLVNTLLSKVVPLPGALRYQPRNANYLMDDIDLLIDNLESRYPEVADVAKAFDQVVDWMEQDAELWKVEHHRNNYTPEDFLSAE